MNGDQAVARGKENRAAERQTPDQRVQPRRSSQRGGAPHHQADRQDVDADRDRHAGGAGSDPVAHQAAEEEERQGASRQQRWPAAPESGRIREVREQENGQSSEEAARPLDQDVGHRRKGEAERERPLERREPRDADPGEEEQHRNRFRHQRPDGLAGALGKQMPGSRRDGENESGAPEARKAACFHDRIVSRRRPQSGPVARRE